MDELFDTYAASLPRVTAWADAQFPPPDGEPSAAHARAIQAKALDLLRGLLPAASLSHMGIYATGQTYEQLILHLLAHPLPEARALRPHDPRRGQGRHPELRRPRRAPRPRRRVDRLPRGRASRRPSAGSRGSASAGAPRTPRRRRPSVRLLHVDGDEDALLAALLFEAAGASEEETRIRLSALGADERGAAARRPRRRAAPTAATAPAAASRPCATASRSSRTTARSATSSATGC